MARVVDRRKVMDEILIGITYGEGGKLVKILKESQVERQLVLSILPDLEAILLDNEMRGRRE
ncbi:MAG: hypothetical protein A3C38_02825 [Planctomycetes bacterium RIFCSPHIGHO2_02_FULL_50_42]|nr:MAG: hypothetical protein A2060_04570 [Planctomycetes bacterium GWA2_50_13]OHB87763.1 MAG: hypothetical protein A3C38_02825 [Planctomycetes bacterium RIFCSPHIGHO2_02_FULL_50_42]OHB91859.1 MAG: hypothetical protein A3E75_01035 [Planctomycetes bacterium RIFCSPHIGHO2_12_FULL_51_37]OHB95115.1 MAG: hypothetical protein A3I59_03615 [Planctomycetes bacterium RIFCSPLOWO2_02_FULL_50_16]OHC04370.1 MAG: hypothetical protein A3G17_05085 [Planctomycetes bacterium RIFCSPLOWO2_12_FULL_50_35]